VKGTMSQQIPDDGGDKVTENPEGDPRTALAIERTSFAKFRSDRGEL